MHPLLTNDTLPRIQQTPGKVSLTQLNSVDQLLLILPERVSAATWRSLPGAKALQAAYRKRPAKSCPALLTRLASKRSTLVVGGQIGTAASRFEKLTLGRKLLSALLGDKAGTLGIIVAGFDESATQELAQCMLAAALAAAAPMPEFKSEATPAPIRQIRLLGLKERLDVSRVQAEAEGNNLARWLTVLPPNKLDAVNFAAIAKSMAKACDWQFKKYDTRALEKLGAGAFLAVAQGNENDSASIVRLRYTGRNKSGSPDLSLVGKGIIFDTGGTNLKPFQSMLDMHGDMQGSAVALGSLLAISRLGLPLNVDCWLAITENRTGPEAYKSQDVVTAANGKTIQTIHTDAEGRMALADTLTLASREKPKIMLDYATLTGSCVNAITTSYCGVFTNQPHWHPRLKQNGAACGERVWPFPIGKEFLAALKSPVADLMQCSVKGEGDHILAGSFLAEFIENDVPWVHMDLSASNHSGGLGHVPTEVTGFGVNYTLALLLDERLGIEDGILATDAS